VLFDGAHAIETRSKFFREACCGVLCVIPRELPACDES
jgi:hypothetical protein